MSLPDTECYDLPPAPRLGPDGWPAPRYSLRRRYQFPCLALALGDEHSWASLNERAFCSGSRSPKSLVPNQNRANQTKPN